MTKIEKIDVRVNWQIRSLLLTINLVIKRKIRNAQPRTIFKGYHCDGRAIFVMNMNYQILF